MQEDQAAQVDDERDTTAEALAADSTTEAEAQPADDGSGDGGAAADASGDDGMAGAVDDRAAQLTGGQGAAATDSPVTDRSGAVDKAEEHLGDTNLAADRETLKALQKDM